MPRAEWAQARSYRLATELVSESVTYQASAKAPERALARAMGLEQQAALAKVPVLAQVAAQVRVPVEVRVVVQVSVWVQVWGAESPGPGTPDRQAQSQARRARFHRGFVVLAGAVWVWVLRVSDSKEAHHHPARFQSEPDHCRPRLGICSNPTSP